MSWNRATLIRRFFPGARLARFRRLWTTTYDTGPSIIDRLHKLPGDHLIPPTLWKMASALKIRRPIGFKSVERARFRSKKETSYDVRMTIASAKRRAAQEKVRQQQLRKLSAAAKPPKNISQNITTMAVPEWLRKERRNTRQRAWRAKRKALASAQPDSAARRKPRRRGAPGPSAS